MEGAFSRSRCGFLKTKFSSGKEGYPKERQHKHKWKVREIEVSCSRECSILFNSKE